LDTSICSSFTLWSNSSSAISNLLLKWYFSCSNS
jgi:hypothetical protein